MVVRVVARLLGGCQGDCLRARRKILPYAGSKINLSIARIIPVFPNQPYKTQSASLTNYRCAPELHQQAALIIILEAGVALVRGSPAPVALEIARLARA